MTFDEMKNHVVAIGQTMELMAERTRVILAGLNDLQNIEGEQPGEVFTVGEQRAELLAFLVPSLQSSQIINNHIQRANSDPEGYAGWLDKLVEAETAAREAEANAAALETEAEAE